MAMLKVNSIIAESHYDIVINKVAGNAISPLTSLTAVRRLHEKKKLKPRENDRGAQMNDAVARNTKRCVINEREHIREVSHKLNIHQGNFQKGSAALSQLSSNQTGGKSSLYTPKKI